MPLLIPELPWDPSEVGAVVCNDVVRSVDSEATDEFSPYGGGLVEYDGRS